MSFGLRSLRRSTHHSSVAPLSGVAGRFWPLRGNQLGLLLPLVQSPPAVAPQVAELLSQPRGPNDHDALGPVGGTKPHEQPALAGRQVAAAAVHEAHLLRAAGFDLYPRPDGVAV